MTPILVGKPETMRIVADAHNFGSRRALGVDMIVIHTMEGSLRGTARWFQNPDAQASAHYGIGSDGSTIQFVDESFAAWHCGNGVYNRRSIGVELEGHMADPEMFTDPLYEGLLLLCRYLVSKYAIQPDRKHIIGHAEVPHPIKAWKFGGVHGHTDPGHLFPWWDQLIADLSAPAVS